jgi:hypothetical protein
MVERNASMMIVNALVRQALTVRTGGNGRKRFECCTA